MTLILALGLVWLLLATVVAMVIGRAIRLADTRTGNGSGIDRLLADARRDPIPARSARAGFDRVTRTV